MTEPSPTAPPSGSTGPDHRRHPPFAGAVPLAERLVRALCVAGLVLALASVVQFLAPLFQQWQFGFLGFHIPGSEAAYVWLLLGQMVLVLAADGMLVAGAAGELLRRAWARRLLRWYVYLWFAGCLFGLAGYVAYQRYVATSFFQRPLSINVGWLLAGQVGSVVAESVYPVLLLVCLRWPETKRATAHSRGFTPVLSAEAE